MENKFIKEFEVQEGAKKYGLGNIILELNKNIEFPYYGLLFAQKIAIGTGKIYEYKSFLKDDFNCLAFEDTLAFKLLKDKNLKIGQKIDKDNPSIVNYFLIYFNYNSSIFKPTVLKSFDNLKYDFNVIINIEFLFVFEDEFISPVEHVFSLSDIYHPSFRINVEDLLWSLDKDVTAFFARSSIFSETENGFEIETCSVKTGEIKTFSFNYNKFNILKNNLVSCRITEVKKEISPEKYESIGSAILM